MQQLAEDIPITFAGLRAIASSTRFSLMRHLRDRRMTVSELSAACGRKKATVHSHLRMLVNAGLVERHEDVRLWVYYSLTPTAQCLVETDRPRFVLVGTLALGSLLGGFLLLWWAIAGSGGALATGNSGLSPGDVRRDGTTGGVPLEGLLVAAALLLTVGLGMAAFGSWRAWSFVRNAK